MAIIVGTLTKDPQETRLFKMDWTAHIGIGTIANSAWEIPAGLTLVANGIVQGNTKTYVTVSGGTAGYTYILTNTVYISSNNEVWQRSGRLDVRQL
jgi:hypothetical protein